MKSWRHHQLCISKNLGVNVLILPILTDAELQHQPKVQGGDPYLSASCNQILLKAEDIAKELGDEFVAVEPLLLALLAVQSSAS